MILITSGAYISQEFSSEIGILPPSFLPLSNRRLFEHQIKLCSGLGADIYISVPDSYEMELADLLKIESKGARIVKVPDDISLGESILYCWNATGNAYNSLAILHGDTLFSEIPDIASNYISLHRNSGYYKRAKVVENERFGNGFEDVWASDDDLVVSGFFSFQKPQILMEGIDKFNGSFVNALQHYSQKIGLSPLTRGRWYDFGHLNSFFRSRTEMTTQRSFNEMTITPRLVHKSSENTFKITAEVNWFESLPSELTVNTPKLISKIRDGESVTKYSLEYLYLLPLSDLFVFGKIGLGTWKQIFKAAVEILEKFSKFSPESVSPEKLNSLYLEKTLKRLTEFSEEARYNIYEPLNLCGSMVSLTEMAINANTYINEPTQGDIGLIHGDFCFSNLLFDSRSQSIKMIDPRGLDGDGELSIYGDRRYDFAKLYHSAVGFYDLIIADRFDLKYSDEKSFFELELHNSESQSELEKLFKEYVLKGSGYSEKEIIAINIHLFLSMLPLHSDKPVRQKAMIANAARLYKKLMRINLGK